MKIGCDLDEVIVEFTKPFLDFYNLRNKTRFAYGGMRTYNLRECLGISEKKEQEEIDKFYETNGFRNAPLVFGAFEGLDKILQTNSVVIVTSRPLRIKKETEKFARLYFPNVPVLFSGDFLNNGLKTKAEISRELGFDWFIEDRHEYAVDIARTGVEVFLLDKPWNQEKVNGRVTRVKNWGEIMEKIGAII